MILYLTYNDDGFLRLHTKIPGKDTCLKPDKIELFYITEKELKYKWDYLDSHFWWRAKSKL